MDKHIYFLEDTEFLMIASALGGWIISCAVPLIRLHMFGHAVQGKLSLDYSPIGLILYILASLSTLTYCWYTGYSFNIYGENLILPFEITLVFCLLQFNTPGRRSHVFISIIVFFSLFIILNSSLIPFWFYWYIQLFAIICHVIEYFDRTCKISLDYALPIQLDISPTKQEVTRRDSRNRNRKSPRSKKSPKKPLKPSFEIKNPFPRPDSIEYACKISHFKYLFAFIFCCFGRVITTLVLTNDYLLIIQHIILLISETIHFARVVHYFWIYANEKK